MSKHSLHIVVICCNEERRAFQKRQFAALKLPYDVTYAWAYSPDTSRDYIADYDTKCPEFDTTLCCMRSHAAVLDWFYHNTTSDYVLVMEDDVGLLKSGFAARVDHIIDLWSKHSSEIDYVSLGYLISTDAGIYPGAVNHDEELYWGEQGEDVLWGMQAYLVKRQQAKDMIDILHQPNTIELRKRVKAEMAKGRDYSHRYPRVQSDSLYPLLFRQGFVIPMLAIETPFQSAIQGHNVTYARWKKAIDKGTINLEDFYS